MIFELQLLSHRTNNINLNPHKKPMLSLGIEGTAHTLGIGIIDDKGKILSDVKSSFFPPKGIHPREAAEHHAQIAPKVLKDALKTAKINPKDLDIISFSQGPGLPPCLRITATFARALSLKLKKPLVGVNHCISHIDIAKLMTKSSDPIVLYVSGGNSQVIGKTCGKYRVFGETLDIAIGNAIDKFARECNLGFPGGPIIEKLAKKGKYIELPYTVKGMDFSYSGLVTDIVRKYKQGAKLEDLSFSFQEHAFAMLTEVTERALAHTEKNEVLITGGVAANKRLGKMLSTMCKERGAKYFACPMQYAGDNGVMIAWSGILNKKKSKTTNLKDSRIRPKWRVDDN